LKKYILGTLLVLLILASIFGYKLIFGKPFHISHFYERIFIENVRADPEFLTVIGAIENTAFDFHSAKLTDFSPGFLDDRVDQSRHNHEILHSYNRGRLSGQAAITYDMLDWYLGMKAEEKEWIFHNYYLHQMQAPHTTSVMLLTDYHQIVNERSAENYIARLQAFQTKFEQIGETVRTSAAQGVIPPRFVFDHVMKDMRDFIDTPPDQNILYEHFANNLAMMAEDYNPAPENERNGNHDISIDYDDDADWDEDSRELDPLSAETIDRLLTDAADAIRNHVYPGYETLITLSDSLYTYAPEDIGVWSLPDGDRYYEFMTRYHATFNITPEEVHQIGLDETARLESEMFAIFEDFGITGGTIAERFDLLDEDSGLFYPDTGESYQQIIDDYTANIAILAEQSRPLFHTTPRADVVVRRVPSHMEESAPFAYYGIPAMDGSRPGVFYTNLADISKIPKYTMMSLTAHEAIPGHHFQIALQFEIDNLPTIRIATPFTAHMEGWALYAEWLMAEAGVYDDDPLGNLGRLQMEMFRAARLVTDTGIHLKQWSRDEAIAYIYDITGLPYNDMVTEVERYAVMPGQAIAYKLGMIRFQELRQQAEKALGDRFDIAEFHDVLLLNAAMPLDVLTGVVDEYIVQKSRNSY